MIQRTLYVGNPYHLSLELGQMVLRPKDPAAQAGRVPIEDLGYLVLDNPQISLSQALLAALGQANVALVVCDEKRLPVAQLLGYRGHHAQNLTYRHQVAASAPLVKNLWKQTTVAKILNQAALLQSRGLPADDLRALAAKVRSGDPENLEAQAARKYWPRLFGPDFLRDRHGPWPNAALNYGYAVLRAGAAKALVGAGLLPGLGIHHHSRYNPYCLADDIMEPFRPFVDQAVAEWTDQEPDAFELGLPLKAALLETLQVDAHFLLITRPLALALAQSAASLAQCFRKEARNLAFPELFKP